MGSLVKRIRGQLPPHQPLINFRKHLLLQLSELALIEVGEHITRDHVLVTLFRPTDADSEAEEFLIAAQLLTDALQPVVSPKECERVCIT